MRTPPRCISVVTCLAASIATSINSRSISNPGSETGTLDTPLGYVSVNGSVLSCKGSTADLLDLDAASNPFLADSSAASEAKQVLFLKTAPGAPTGCVQEAITCLTSGETSGLDFAADACNASPMAATPVPLIASIRSSRGRNSRLLSKAFCQKPTARARPESIWIGVSAPNDDPTSGQKNLPKRRHRRGSRPRPASQ